MSPLNFACHALAAACTFAALASMADGVGIVEKRVFELPVYSTVGGTSIKHVRVGYETYGRLNEAGDNAIFIPHYFSGTSHAAGRYAESDPLPGYWDEIIGPGRAIDTDKYFVVSADALANVNFKDPNVVTTGPASIDPDTGRPYGLSFPVISYRDTVRVHKALVDSLGVRRLVGTVGASGGSIQAMEWGALYPDFVPRIVQVIGPGFEIHPYVLAMVDVWSAPIRLDPAWNGGDYYGRAEPVEGVAQALTIITLMAQHWDWAAQNFGYEPESADRPPAERLSNRFRIEAALAAAGAARAALVDANHLLYMSKANQLYRLSEDEIAGIKAKILFIPASSDVVFPPALSERAQEQFSARGGRAEFFMIEGGGGHLDGLYQIGQAARAIFEFLASD